MLRPTVTAAAFALLATPALAYIAMTVENHTGLAVTEVHSYPLTDDGEIIEDHIGGFYGEIPPGASGSFEIAADCGPTLFLVYLAGSGPGDDLRFAADTCAERLIVVAE